LAPFAMLVLCVGVPVGWAWAHLPTLAKASAITNFVSMLGVLAWFHLSAPDRLCNNYL
jgi:hypothetical protein